MSLEQTSNAEDQTLCTKSPSHQHDARALSKPRRANDAFSTRLEEKREGVDSCAYRRESGRWMRSAKRARTAGPIPSSSSSYTPSSPPPSASTPRPLVPTSSITALGQRLFGAARLSSTQSAEAAHDSLGAHLSSSADGEMPASTNASCFALPKMEREGYAGDEDEIMNDGRAVSPRAAKAEAAPTPARLAAANEAAKPMPHATGPTPAVKQPKPPSSSPPLSQMPPSATQRRSAEEIEQRKNAALKLVRHSERLQVSLVTEMDTCGMQREMKAAEKKQAERDKKRKELASVSLARFGFTMAPAISRYGSGRGGVSIMPEPGAPPEEPRAWTPDERCSPEQLAVLDQVRAGGNVFFTGSAGVGKSFLLQEITRLLEHERRQFQVTATTGIAALQVSGITIHSWAGVGLAKDVRSASTRA